MKRTSKGDGDAVRTPSLLDLAFISSDKNHVAEKCRMWRGMTKSCHPTDLLTEEVTAHNIFAEDAKPMEDCKDIWWLCERLAAANTRRREQLDYWVEHPYDIHSDEAKITALEDRAIAPFRFRQSAGGNEQDQKVGRKDSGEHFKGKGSSKSESRFSKPSFSAAAFSDVHETDTNVRPRTVYARTTTTIAANGGSRSVPDPPEAAKNGLTFTCPYCGMTLDSRAMDNRKSWK
jgi:hypothetical protein